MNIKTNSTGYISLAISIALLTSYCASASSNQEIEEKIALLQKQLNETQRDLIETKKQFNEKNSNTVQKPVPSNIQTVANVSAGQKDRKYSLKEISNFVKDDIGRRRQSFYL